MMLCINVYVPRTPRSKFSMSYHVQSRHSPRTKQIDHNRPGFSMPFIAYSLVPRMSTDLKDQCDHLIGQGPPPSHHFLQAFHARSKVFVSCGIDMGEICQLALGHLHPQVRQTFRKCSDCDVFFRFARSANVIDSTD